MGNSPQMTLMIGPDNSTANVPNENVNDAIKMGAKIGISMIAPDGSRAVVPHDNMMDAIKMGARPEAPLPTSLPTGSQMQTSSLPGMVRNTANVLPAAGMMAGGALGSVEPGGGNIAGAALGGAGGEAARSGLLAMMGQQQPAPFSGQNLAALGKAAATGAGAEMGGQLIGKGVDAVSGAISRMAGIPQATSKAMEEYSSDVAEQQEAIRQRAIGARQNAATYQDAQLANAESNAAKKVQYQQQVSSALDKIPAAPPGQQELWVDLNKSVQVPPSAIKVKLGATDLTEAMTMPGRGMAQEGLKAADLAKMTPPEQNAVIAPKWHAAGQRIDALAQAATDAGKTVDVRSVDDAVNNMLDKNDRDGMNRILTRIGKGVGLRGRAWQNITPTQALAMKRALWEYGENGEYVARAISGALRDQVPELKAADQLYSDLNGAMTSIRTQYGRYSAGKFTPPQMEPTLPEPPQMTPFSHPGYKDLPAVPPTPVQPDLAALQNELIKKFGIKAGKTAAKALIPTAGGAIGAYEYMKNR